VARNADSSWVYIWTDDNRFGWVAASLLTIEGDLERVSLQSSADALSLAPTVKAMPTQTLIPTQKLIPTSTHKPFVFITSTPVQSVLLCSQTANKIGKYVSCKIERAYCDYLPSVDGAPTFCDDRPYPNQNFQLVVFGADWSGYDGYCIMVSGTVSLYRGIPQILATRRSQVSYCQ
jgi:3',5'-cyclic AMP phosphodiesterase CpdA